MQTRIYDRLDGAQPNAPYFNSAAYSPDGRVWFANGQVVQMVDPSTLSRQALPAPTYIESVIVDRREFAATGNLGLAPQPRDLQIDYTSPTFTIPQKVKFRYRLDPYDSDWHDAGTRRQAFYTDLPPGNYTFRVIAANSDGVWTETPAKLDFSIAPAYFQTNWFRALCAGLFLAMLWMAYRLRVRHLQRRFEMTLLAEEKLREKDDALEMARTELARVSRLTTLGELTTSIAHEVSQPLGAMVASAGACARWLAADPPAMAEARSALDNIVADGKRAREVIARIRALTKRQAPRMDLLDLNREILEVLALTEQELRSHDIVLETKLDSTLPQVMGDRVQLQQVLLNLIVNAIEAMSAVNNRPRELTIVSAQGTDGVVVEVRDSGIGLDQDRAERVFDAFYTTKAEGLGIGLSISRSIVEAHGGRLWAAPNQPHGAVFGFSLPVAENGQLVRRARARPVGFADLHNGSVLLVHPSREFVRHSAGSCAALLDLPRSLPVAQRIQRGTAAHRARASRERRAFAQRARRAFRTFVDRATDAFFLLDEQLNVVDVNRRPARASGTAAKS